MKRILSKIYTSYPILSLLAYIFTAISTNAYATEILIPATSILSIKDGDSFDFENKRIRLIGLDAPEYDQTCYDSQNNLYNCGEKSSAYLKSLLENKEVLCKYDKKDKYNRYLCKCYTNDFEINKELILSGNAIVYMESPYRLEQIKAKQLKKGIWQGKFMHPRLFRLLKKQEKRQK